MLDFVKLGLLVSQLSAESLSREQDGKSTLADALAAYVESCNDSAAFETKISLNAPWILWPTATPIEPLDTIVKVPLLETTVTPWTVLGVDGSQIMPNQHEVHNCYLLNCGLTRISYGLDLPPQLTSEPRLYARPEDLYPLVDRRRVYIDELYVSLERSIFELENLTERALAVCTEPAQGAAPVLALYDGSLIPWSVEKMNESYLETYLVRFEDCLRKLREANVALLGYVSKSRAADVVNCLRSFICPYETSHCREHCGHLNEEEFPCSRIWPLADRRLYESILAPSERSAAMLSGASIVKSMSEANTIAFCYLRSDAETARLEFPTWLVRNKELFRFALSAVATQVVKGQGYPLALAEAHHLAVIKGPDRERFFEILGQQMMHLGIGRVQPSPKESRKRTGFV